MHFKNIRLIWGYLIANGLESNTLSGSFKPGFHAAISQYDDDQFIKFVIFLSAADHSILAAE